MNPSQIPNYLKIAHWLHLQGRPVSYDEIADFFSLTEKQVSFYISVMREREEFVSCSFFSKDHGTVVTNNLISAHISNTSLLDALSNDFKLKFTNKATEQNQQKHGIEATLWHLALKTRTPFNLQYNSK